MVDRGSELISRITLWRPGRPPEDATLEDLPVDDALFWIELRCAAGEAQQCLAALAGHCPSLDQQMLHDLLTPDEQPAGIDYLDGAIRLASAFRATARRPQLSNRRGTAQGIGALVFEPIELLASEKWLITCTHPSRTFRGAEVIEEGEPLDADALNLAVAKRWAHREQGNAADLGIAAMYELALTYRRAQRELSAWLEDWELSLYVEDDLDNADELPELWSLMAVLRDWLNPLNPPGLRADIDKAWLPASDHEAVIAVDERVDKTLAGLSRLAETLRQSFGLLHIEQAEAQRRHGERLQRRIEVAAAVFLVPTLIVGFYGANTWVPGQGRHWGFWVMVGALIVLSVCALVAVLFLQRRTDAAAARDLNERKRIRTESLNSGARSPAS